MERLLITGEPRSGKSTLIRKLSEFYSAQVTGIFAGEIKDTQGQRIGFRAESLGSPEVLVLAHKASPSKTRVSSYGVHVDTLDLLAQELGEETRRAYEGKRVLLFDEIGPMQGYSPKLREEITRALGVEVPAIMTIKLEDREMDWIQRIKGLRDTRMITLTPDTRGEVLKQLEEYVTRYSR
jgi:nucleoside-triphosphatase THEP1